MTKIESITFVGCVYKVSTIPGGGCRITLDVPESESEEALKLARLQEMELQVAVVPVLRGKRSHGV